MLKTVSHDCRYCKRLILSNQGVCHMGVATLKGVKAEENVIDGKISLKEKISYGMGDFGNGFMFDLGQLYLLKFLQM